MERKAELYDTRHRRTWRVAFLASLLVHVLILLLLRGRVVLRPTPFAPAGSAPTEIRLERGGSDLFGQQITAAPRALEPVDLAEVPIAVEMPEVEIAISALRPAEIAMLYERALAGRGRGAGTGEVGRGAGQEARTGRVTGPRPRGLILPPGDAPGNARGTDVTVFVFVTTEGIVVPDSTRIEPSSGDRKFDDRLREQAARWLFRPAMRDGRPVADWFRYRVLLRNRATQYAIPLPVGRVSRIRADTKRRIFVGFGTSIAVVRDPTVRKMCQPMAHRIRLRFREEPPVRSKALEIGGGSVGGKP